MSKNMELEAVPLTGGELWEWLFGALKGNVPEALTDEVLDGLAAHVRTHFISRLSTAPRLVPPSLRRRPMADVDAVLDATDMDMIRRGDRLGPKLGAKVARILEGIEELRGERDEALSILALVREEVEKDNAPYGRSDSIAMANVRVCLGLTPLRALSLKETAP